MKSLDPPGENEMSRRLDVRRLNLPLEVSYSTRNKVKTVRYLYTGIPSLYTKGTEPRVLIVEVFLLERVESSKVPTVRSR